MSNFYSVSSKHFFFFVGDNGSISKLLRFLDSDSQILLSPLSLIFSFLSLINSSLYTFIPTFVNSLGEISGYSSDNNAFLLLNHSTNVGFLGFDSIDFSLFEVSFRAKG